ncbi:hypothetical protein [Actinomadura sp. 7K534]|uniref:hypothetical protein n=1 Tax=Actinomadura sp. 7K534 TaxID=2530366 RepID=UPI00105115FA|nr:hypothetical protein [Actinomadura sp. 7K534]TDB90279.1 hypothetical protein E1266_28510 [Actinomadura sp. 7K534]
MVDEMDLLKGLGDTEPVRPRAFDEARAVLRAAIAEEEVPETRPAGAPAPRGRGRWGGRRTAVLGAGALVAAAAAVALGLSLTSAPAPGESPASASGNPILARLVADNAPLRPEMPGDATLEIRNQSPTSDALGDHGIGLFTDDGTYYWGNDRKALRKAVVENRGDGFFKGPIAVALHAVKGDIGTARERMAAGTLAPGEQPDLEKERAERLKRAAKERGEEYVPPKPLTAEQKKQITDNHIWSNSIDALIAAPENPQVRAGVLRIMATMPRVEVTETSTAGRPTLTVTDSWPANGRFVETLVIDAATGRPVALTDRAPNAASRTVYYHSSRVTVADVKAGRF